MPVQAPCRNRTITLTAVVVDALDGAMRLLCDAQRFGFGVRRFHLDAGDEREAAIRMTLVVPPEADAAHVRSRFARHPAVRSIEAA